MTSPSFPDTHYRILKLPTTGSRIPYVNNPFSSPTLTRIKSSAALTGPS